MGRSFRFVVLVVVLALSVLACQSSITAPSKSPASVNAGIETPVASAGSGAVVRDAKIPDTGDLPGENAYLQNQDSLVRVYETAHLGVVALRVISIGGTAQGSGFVVDQEGHIITNYHVVEGGTELEVSFPSGQKARGIVIGQDLDSDVAVVKVKVNSDILHPLQLGDSSQVKVGQTVIAIGNPFGLNGSMTMGIISGVGRTVRSPHISADGSAFSAGDILQTDAAINPGNSGGPLLNLNGEVIGVNGSIRTTTFTTEGQPLNSGIGFAIPINLVKRVLPTLLDGKKYEYPYLGILSTDDLTLEEMEVLHLENATGVYITNLVPGSPAEAAGLRGADRESGLPGLQAGGDLIIAVDDRPLVTYNDLIGYLVFNKRPGDRVQLTVLRDAQLTTIEVTLGKRPDS